MGFHMLGDKIFCCFAKYSEGFPLINNPSRYQYFLGLLWKSVMLGV